MPWLILLSPFSACPWRCRRLGVRNQARFASDVLLGDFDSSLQSIVRSHVVAYLKRGDELLDMKLGTDVAYAFHRRAGVTCFVIGPLCFVQGAQPVIYYGIRVLLLLVWL